MRRHEEPGSEHNDYSKDEHFNRLQSSAAQALKATEELAGPAQLFLSQQATAALHELVRDDWNAAYGAAFPGEYIDSALPLVKKAMLLVLNAAKTQLGTDR
jgi:hypothetical protein